MATKKEQAPVKETKTNPTPRVSTHTAVMKKADIEAARKILKKTANVSKKDAKTVKKEAKFEDKPDIRRLYLVIIVVDIGVSKSVEKLMQDVGSSMQFTHNGRGTASKEILNILGMVDNTKGVVNAVISEDRLDDVKRELSIFFAASKKNRGIAFTIPFTSVEGVRIYKYLTQTI